MDGATMIEHDSAPAQETPLDADDAPMESDPAARDDTSAADDAPQIEPHRVVEAVLMAAENPLTAAKVASILGFGTARDVKKHIESLNVDYDKRAASFRIEEIAGGYQILTRPEFNTWLTKLLRVRQETRLTPAAMETLAIIAYKQPCTRAEVESVRGVAAGDGVNRLREMNLVKIVGRAEDLGRPLLYGTTRKFLEVFGLPSLDDLPQVEALKPPPSRNESKKAANDNAQDSSPDAGKQKLQIVREEDDSGEALTESIQKTSDEPMPDA